MMRWMQILVAGAMLAGCSGADALNALSAGIGVEPVQNIRYAPGERGTMDVYTPRKATPDTPLVVFFYGGSWQEGERGLYEFLGNALAQAGIETVVPDYRVYPQVKFPSFVGDGAKAVAKVSETVANGRPIVLVGHSAGAHIAAMLAFAPSYLNDVGIDRCRTVAGFAGLAGPYDFLPLTDAKLKRVFPLNLRQAAQPINAAGGPDPAALLLHGLADETVQPKDSRNMAAALKRSGSTVTAKLYPGVDHTDIVGAIAPLTQSLAPTRDDLIPWIKAQATRAGPYCSGP